MAMEKGWKAQDVAGAGAFGMGVVDEEEDDAVAAIPPPQTPLEPMEYLSRSWSVSASEISKILVGGGKKSGVAPAAARLPEMTIPEDSVLPTSIVPLPYHQQHRDARRNSMSSGHHQSIGRWFQVHHREACRVKQSGKEKQRADKAHVHAMVSVARVAAAVAAVAAATSCDAHATKMAAAMASATELLASHCVEAAQHAGARHDQVAGAVQAAVGVRSPGDLMTLTAAAATALRGAATLKQRVQRETRSNASVLPYEKGSDKGHSWSTDIWCKEGELLKRTRKGDLHKTRVSIYINKRSQVMLKLKSKHIGGALSKNNKSVVYGVYSELPTWPQPGKDSVEETCCFGLSTAQGLVEFECDSSASKQKWVDDVQNLLRQVALQDQVGNKLGLLKLH
ncbi:unnamed protein product [Urochloa humidicola]